MCVFRIGRYDLSVICAAQCRIVVFVKVKRSVMELQVLEFCRVTRDVILLILTSRTDIVVIVGGTVVWMLRAEMRHFTVVHGIA